MGWWHDMRLNHKDCRLFWLVHRFVRRSLSEGGSLGEGGSRPRWGWGSAAPSGRSYRGTASAPSGRGYSGGRGYKTRDGVALIVVLGFLSIMLMMAVAFLTQARIERMVSDYSLEAQRGRQFVRTALNAAMNDYSRYLAAERLVMPITDEARLFTSIARPGFRIPGPDGTLGGNNIELLVGEAEEWIPRVYMRHLVPASEQTPDMLDGPAISADAEWILVREDPSQAQSRILGRYAYAVFDMSGGIDANLIARIDEVAGHDARVASNRVRRSVRDVPMRMLPEVANYGEFKRLRRGWKGFDSLQTLILLTDGNAEDGNSSHARWQLERKEIYGAALISNLVSDLGPFSLSAFRGARYSRASGLWSPYTLVNDSTSWSSVLNPLSSQFAAGWNTWIDKAVRDYTSSSVTPVGTDYPSPKNVPMFNEVAGTLTLRDEEDLLNPGSRVYFLDVELNFEFWYPFPSKDNEGGSFTLPPPTIGGSYDVTGEANIWMRLGLVGGTNNPPTTFKIGPPAVVPSDLSVPAQYNNGRPYSPMPSPNFSYSLQITQTDGNPIEPGARLMIQGAMVRQPIYLQAGGGNADEIAVDITLSGSVNLAPGDEPAKFARAVTDPRLNHLDSQWEEERDGSGSLNEINDAIQSGGASYQAFIREGTNLYCRNGPMETPAELGFIPTGNEWETIDLCTPEAATVLAGLVTDTNLFNTGRGASATWTSESVFYTNGTINPNTQSSNVLMSAFADLPRHEAPNIHANVVGANPLSDDSPDGMDILTQLVGGILEETETGDIEDCFQSGTDWIRIPAMQQNGAMASLGMNNNQREELIRRTWGLFNPGNSLFTVVVVAQAIKEGPTGVGLWNADQDLITGERRAVALVWRDPYKTGQNLHHEMFVRMFRYLND